MTKNPKSARRLTLNVLGPNDLAQVHGGTKYQEYEEFSPTSGVVKPTLGIKLG